MLSIKELMSEIINEKFDELSLNNPNTNDIFWKIKFFEGNAIGAIGEKFIKQIFINYQIDIDDDPTTILHDEYDIKSNGKKIEIKTARLGANKTYQFNGINPRYNHDLIICIGISNNDINYHIFKKSDINYIHSNRQYTAKINDTKTLSLVEMNPGNSVNYKITINKKYMNILDDNFPNIIKSEISSI